MNHLSQMCEYSGNVASCEGGSSGSSGSSADSEEVDAQLAASAAEEEKVIAEEMEKEGEHFSSSESTELRMKVLWLC